MSSRIQTILSLNTVETDDKDHLVEKLTQRLSSLEKLTATLLLENTALREENSGDGSSHPNNATSLSQLNPELVADMAYMIENSMSEVMKSHDKLNAHAMRNITENNINSHLNVDKLLSIENMGSQPEEDSSRMVSLMSGDLISLRHEDIGCRGLVLGDTSSKTIGVKIDDPTTMNPRFIDGVFRICTGLNFRARTEGSKMRKAMLQGNHGTATEMGFNPRLASMREELERLQNDEHIEQLVIGEGTELIKFGDAIQLQHVASGLFLACHKTPAPLNPNCRRVSLKHGSFACNFRILPRFKVRSVGALVYAGDQIQLQSLKFEHLRLGASQAIPDRLPNEGRISNPATPSGGKSGSGAFKGGGNHFFDKLPPLSSSVLDDRVEMLKQCLRPPVVIKHRAKCEVNASMDTFRNFTAHLYHRPSKSNVLRSGRYFRLFHPEANAFMQASADSDKGEILDATGEEGDPLRRLREDGTKAHVPYLKNFVTSSADASNPIHLSAKAVWCFEPVDLSHCIEIRFNSPLRLKHVPSGKFLAVDTSKELFTRSNSDVSYEGQDNISKMGSIYEASLVFRGDPDIEEGKLGSMSSLVFYLVPTDFAGDTLRSLVSAVRLEHRSAKGKVLHFYAPRSKKPKLSQGGMPLLTSRNAKERGTRICFSSELSSLDVLRIQPLTKKDMSILSCLMSKISLFKLYSYRWLTAAAQQNPVPNDLTEAVVAQCLDLLDELKKASGSRRHGGSVSENIKEACVTPPLEFAALHGGCASHLLQKMCLELKLLDAVFDCTLAPYNYTVAIGKHVLFDGLNNSDNFKAVQKFLYVVIQCMVRDNLLAQKYFTEKCSRTWRLIVPRRKLSIMLEENPLGLMKLDMEKKFVRWRDLIIDHGEETLGATVTLGQLLHSSESIVQRLVNNDLMVRFKLLVEKCGPELRFINLFNAVCFIEGRPSRPAQEMCVRMLWMNPIDRYSFGVTFHELKKESDQQLLPPRGLRFRAPDTDVPLAYLGKTKNNLYDPVVLCWTGSPEWKPHCGALWFSPKAMNVPAIKAKEPGITSKGAEYVQIEQLMWVLEPYRLCQPVTGSHWKPFPIGRTSTRKRSLRQQNSLLNMGISNLKLKVAKNRFSKQLVLANYVIAELELLTQMCKGRSYNCIRWLEKNFSYDMLLNMATNPHLPYSCNAASMGLVQALYVDRFPQFTHGGGASLPHKLWLFHDASQAEDENEIRKSVTPVLKDKLTLTSEDAFPAFFLPRLSSAYGDPNPVLSHTDHFKFFLLRKLYNDTVNSFGVAGRLIHSDVDFNRLGMAAIHGQQALLLFGFQSTYIKLKELCVPNGRLLDGRSDLKSRTSVFNPPESRYQAGGSDTEIVLQMKKELVNTFREIQNLCTNYRLGQILHTFKEKAMEWTHAECGPGGCDIEAGYFFMPSVGTSSTRSHHWRSKSARDLRQQQDYEDPEDTPEAQYILQSTPEAELALYHDFEAMFPGGTGEASKLDLKDLCEKPDFDIALVDAIMYDDDEVMSSSLKLLDNIYGQRRDLRKALSEVVLLDRPELPIFGDVHVLRAQITEMMFLTRTSSSWGVSSSVAGPFGDAEFASIMSTLDRLHHFIYDDREDNLPPMSWTEEDVRNQQETVKAARSQGQALDTSSTNSSTATEEEEHKSGGSGAKNGKLPPIHKNKNRAIKVPAAARNIWELDVALKWAKHADLQISANPTNVVTMHQDLLRACNLQEVLCEAILIDPWIAMKDETEKPEDVKESFRRLNMVMRAVLSVGRAFVYNNQRNQEILFCRLEQLEKLSIPSHLAIRFADYSVGDRNVEQYMACMKIQGEIEGTGDWPCKLSDFAQVLVLAILHGNTAVCDKLSKSVPSLFCSIADMRTDFSTAETLDIVFIVCKPERAPNSEMQVMACKYFLSSECRLQLSETLGLCMETAAVAKAGNSIDMGNGSVITGRSEAEDSGRLTPTKNGMNRIGRSISNGKMVGSTRVKNPARLLRLMTALMEGGNERTANMLNLKAGLSIDLTCATLVSHLYSNLNIDTTIGELEKNGDISSPAISPKQPNMAAGDDAGADDKVESNTGSKDSEAASINDVDVGGLVLEWLTESDSIASSLFRLLVEQVFLLPLNTDQLSSPQLWSFLEKIAVPVMETLGSVRSMNNTVRDLCGELVAMLELILMTLVRLNLFDSAIEEPFKEKVINDISDDVESLLSHRQRPPEFLEESFRNAADGYGVESLNVSQFIELMEVVAPLGLGDKTKEATPSFQTKQQWRQELITVFKEADVDGSGAVDLYEFVRLFKQLSRAANRKSGTRNSSIADLSVLQFGHRLNLSTVECAERILQIHRGNGNSLGLKRFSRSDRYGSRLHHVKSSGPISLFSPSHASKKATKLVSASEMTRMRNMTQSRDLEDGRLTMQKKFQQFQSSVSENRLISQALQRRRFSMLCVLEKGAPGPPEGVGRDLSIYQERHKSTVGTHNARKAMSTFTWGKKKTSSISGSKVFPASSDIPHSVSMHKQQRRSVTFASTDEGVEKTPRSPKSFESNSGILRRSQSFFKMARGNRRFDSSGPLTKEDRASIHIQNTFRKMKAKSEMARRKVIARPGGGKNSNRLSGAVALSWSDIAARFVRYLEDHFWESGDVGQVNILIIETLLAHLIKARTKFIDSNGATLTEDSIHKAATLEFCRPFQLSEQELQLYHEKQSKLNQLGVTTLLAKILASLSDDVTVGGLPDRVLHLFVELLDGGNEDIQQTLFEHLIDQDIEGKFLSHIEKRLDHALGLYLEGKKLFMSNSTSTNITLSKEVSEACEHLIQSFRFLQLLCEGHHLGFQDYLRSQAGRASSHVNLVKRCVGMIISLCDTSFVIGRFATMEIKLVSQILSVLIESIQGPCSGNQLVIAKSEVVSALNSIVYSKNARDEEMRLEDPHYVDLRSLSCILLAATLEGREDDIIHNHLSRRLERGALEDFKRELDALIRTSIQKAKHEGRLLTKIEESRIKNQKNALVAVGTVLIELGHSMNEITNSGKPIPAGLGSLQKATSWQSVDDDEADSAHRHAPLVGVVEIAWRGQVERACFPIPIEIQYLSNAMKQSFLDEVDVSSSDKRMGALIKQCDFFIAEMDLVYRKAEQSPVFMFLHNSLPSFKVANYGLVVALNANILLGKSSLGNPSSTIMDNLSGEKSISKLELGSVFVTTGLGAFVTVGYALIIFTNSVTEVPLVIQQVDNEIANAKLSKNKKTWWEIWGSSVYALVLALGFISFHVINFSPAVTLYVFVFLILNVPLGLRAFRIYASENTGRRPWMRNYAIVYDIVIVRSFLRNHLILTLFCFLGYFLNVEFFTLELLDVVPISPVISDIIRSITSPGKALGLVFYLFCVTVIIYASFGMNHFGQSLQVPQYEDNDGNIVYKECGSMLQCFYFIFHEGLAESGNMKEFLNTNFVGSEDFPMRVLYDSVFFVWVGIILLNVITGLMVDTFSSIREEKQSRDIVLANDCFVCGTLRQTYEDMALGNDAPTFDHHLKSEHNLWTYVEYISYLKKKDPTEDSGIESYVRQQLKEQSMEWIPTRTSYFLELNSKTKEQALAHIGIQNASMVDDHEKPASSLLKTQSSIIG